MAFVKLSKERKSFTEPAIHFNKQNCFLNKAFCEKIGATEVGDVTKLDVLYDKEIKRFAIHIHKKGDINAKVSKSHQLQVYLKTVLKSVGKHVPTGEIALLYYDEKTKYWIFKLPKAKNSEVILDGTVKPKRGKKRSKE